MVDSIVGNWKGDGREMKGLMEYLEANQQGDKFDDYNRPISVVITKSGGQGFDIVTTPQGKDAVVDNLTIGKTSQKVIPNIGEIHTDSRIDGNKLVNRSTIPAVPGVEVNITYFVEGGTLVIEMNGNGKGATLKCAKV